MATAAQTIAPKIPPEVTEAVERAGPNFDPAIRKIFLDLYGPVHQARDDSGLRLIRDLAYGPDQRHRLDIHVAEKPDSDSLPVVMFFHGGGFIEGHKNLVGDAIFGHIGTYFARRGFLCVNATYRLAPDAQWPAGAEDVARATQWVHENVAQHGGDPNRIILMGHSAGATHVASALFHRDLRAKSAPKAIAAVLVSGTYDVEESGVTPNVSAYYGDDTSAYAKRATVRNLADIALPTLTITAEYDPPRFVTQCAAFLEALQRETGTRPETARVDGHNHVSEIYHINTDDESVGPLIVDFCRRVAGR